MIRVRREEGSKEREDGGRREGEKEKMRRGEDTKREIERRNKGLEERGEEEKSWKMRRK